MKKKKPGNSSAGWFVLLVAYALIALGIVIVILDKVFRFLGKIIHTLPGFMAIFWTIVVLIFFLSVKVYAKIRYKCGVISYLKWKIKKMKEDDEFDIAEDQNVGRATDTMPESTESLEAKYAIQKAEAELNCVDTHTEKPAGNDFYKIRCAVKPSSEEWLKEIEASVSDWLKLCSKSAESASMSKSVSDFLRNWSNMISWLDTACTLEGTVKFYPYSPSKEMNRLLSGFQLRVQQVIKDSMKGAIQEINFLYSHNADEAMSTYQKYRRDVDCPTTQKLYHCEYSEETNLIAQDAIRQVLEAVEQIKSSVGECTEFESLNVDVDGIMRNEANWRREQLGLSTIEYELHRIDFMEGHDFERWCADLLRKSGFTDVEVTKGSGDQGVDVIAVKDGMRYAIQCKCYSSDLGNKPVQEVHAGKMLYRCHVGVVMTNRHFTAGAKELADATGVLLWDRDKLIEMMGDAK